MRRIYNSILLSLPLLMLCSSACYSQEFCVADYDEYQDAIKVSSANHEDDVIMVVEGSEISHITPQYETGYSLQIDVGYDYDCTENLRPAPKKAKSIKTDNSFAVIPEAQISTSGPLPPKYSSRKTLAAESGASSLSGVEKVLGAPAYMWHHGCAPTALGMLLGYWDMKGMVDLFPGSASTQTESVRQGMASSSHVQDYSDPRDDSSHDIKADSSETNDAHTSDSIADFLHTSWSVNNLRYGWTSSGKIIQALRSYTSYRNDDYEVEYGGYYMFNNTLNWDVLTTEIDNSRPMIFLVDSRGDGRTDHFVTIVGYRTEPRPQYACLDTWHTGVQWYDFKEMESGTRFGIWGAWSYNPASKNMSGAVEEVSDVTHNDNTPNLPNSDQIADPEPDNKLVEDTTKKIETPVNNIIQRADLQKRLAILDVINSLLLKPQS